MQDAPSKRFLQKDDIPLIILSTIGLAIHCWANFFDGIFIDELYYIACGKHLAFGYVDHPPMVAIIAAITRWTLGNSLFALRLSAALAGALIVFLTGRLAREMGGGKYARFLASLSVLVSPLYVVMCGFYSMNVFDQLFWLLGAHLIVQIIRNNKPSYWILFGVCMGLGLQNKISVLFFGFGLFMGMVLTPYRRWFLSPWPWISGAIAFTIFTPHIIWQIVYGWPTLEFIHNATLYKNLPLTPMQFMMEQFMNMHPVLFPVWALGLCWLFFAKSGKTYRIFGWTFLAVLFVLVFKNGKPYYLSPIFTILFASGAIFIESIIHRLGWKWPKYAIAVIVIALGAALIPFGVQILPTETFVQYSNALGIKPSTGEKKEIGPLPQIFADRYGWEELAQSVADVYHKLTPEERTECVLIGGSYGITGAIDYFGPKYELPNAISLHNSYHLWGPGEKSGNVAVVLGIDRKDLEKFYGEIREAAVFDHKYKMPYLRHRPIFVCKNLKSQTLKEIWENHRHYE